MESIYHDIIQLLSQAYDYPKKYSKLNRKHIETLGHKIDSENNADFLQLFNELLDEKKDFVKNEGELYFIDSIKLNTKFGKAEAYIDSFEDIIIEDQSKERFYSQPEDTFPVRALKVIKRFSQEIYWIYPRFKNLYFKIKKQDKKILNFKKHKVRKQQLAHLVFINYFIRDTRYLFRQTLINRQDLLIRLKDIEGNLYIDLLSNNFDSINTHLYVLKEIDGLIVSYKKELKLLIENVESSLNQLFEEIQLKIDTFEFPANRVSRNKVLSKRKRLYESYEQNLNSFRLSYTSLVSHWMFKFDIYAIFSRTTKEFNSAINLADKMVLEKIITPYLPVTEEIESWTNQYNNKIDFNTDILSKKIVGEHLTGFTDSIVLFDIVPVLEDLLQNTKGLIYEIDSEIVIPWHADYRRPMRSRLLKKINTLIVTEAEFKKFLHVKISDEKNSLVKLPQILLQNVNEITQIIEFSIEFYKSSTKEQRKEYGIEFYNSIVRAQNKVKETLTFIQEKRKGIEVNLNAINTNFIRSLNSTVEPFTILTNIRKVQIKNQIEHYKTKLIKLFNQNLKFIKRLWIKLNESINYIKKNYTNIRVLFGISKPADSISNELSDYLSETETAITNLPVMYQRLFNPEPLNTERIYIPRENIIQELNTAFSAWINKKFAPTFIVSEIGNGITTSINFFEKEIIDKYPVSRHIIDHQITDNDSFIDFFKLVFNDIKFKSFEDLEFILNESETKRVIILENVHYFFGRYNNGFSNINLFLEFVSKTNANVFWLCSVNLYAWKYLNHAITISDYFAYVIQIDGLNKEQIIKVIEDRHLPSGYNIQFLKRDSFKISRKFKKMNKQQKQEFLKNDFYNVFYKMTQGNIKLALIFWQMSVFEIKDSIFYMKIKEIDHSFLESLGMPKLINLHNILIHGGLSIKEHSKIFGISESASLSQLLILKNDAVIIKQKDQYLINPLIYRQVVDHLKAIVLIY